MLVLLPFAVVYGICAATLGSSDCVAAYIESRDVRKVHTLSLGGDSD